MDDDGWEDFYGGSWLASMFEFSSYYDYDYFNGSIIGQYDYHHDMVMDDAPAYIAIYIITLLISVPGNLFIVLSVWRNNALHAAVWYMLAAIAISLLMNTITIPFWIVHVRKISWTFGKPLCKLAPFVNTMTTTFACIALAAMCVVRLLSRTIMKRSLREYPLYITVIVVGIISLCSVVMCFPIAVFHDVQSFHSYTFCGPLFPSWIAHVSWYMTHFVITFVMPFLILWSINPAMFFLRRKFFARTTETVTYVRQYDEARPFQGNGCRPQEKCGIRLDEYSNTNGSNGHIVMGDDVMNGSNGHTVMGDNVINGSNGHVLMSDDVMNGHTVMKDDLSLIVGTIDVNQDLRRENKVTLLIFMLALTFTLVIGPLSILMILHFFSTTAIANETVYKASIGLHMVHTFFPAAVPLVCFACSAPLRQGIVKPIRGVFPRSNTYTKV